MKRTRLLRHTALKAKAPLKRSGRIRKVRKVKDHERGLALKVFPDGREICLPTKAGKLEYAMRTTKMWRRQDFRCALCGDKIFYPTFDHENGRGGGKRDDRIEIAGRRHNAALCLECNGKKGSRRIPYILQ